MKLILFDFDGVLVDTLGITYSMDVEMNQHLSLEEHKSFFGGNIHNAVRKNGAPINYSSDYDKIYRIKTREVKVPDKLKELVKKLSKEYNLVIVSSTPSTTIREILEREGIASYFNDFFGSDVHKSKVIKIKMLLEKYKVPPEEAVYITDTTGDIMEARECGVKSIAVTWGFHDEKTLLKANPEKIISNPGDLVKAVKEIKYG